METILAEVIKSIIVQTPMVAVLLLAIKILYEDMKIERSEAAKERQTMLQVLEGIALKLGTPTPAKVQRDE